MFRSQEVQFEALRLNYSRAISSYLSLGRLVLLGWLIFVTLRFLLLASTTSDVDAEIIAKFAGQLQRTIHRGSIFNVAGWQDTYFLYKYDLGMLISNPSLYCGC
jgi:hypothetical protein